LAIQFAFAADAESFGIRRKTVSCEFTFNFTVTINFSINHCRKNNIDQENYDGTRKTDKSYTK